MGSLGLAAVKQGAETVSGQLPLVKAKAAGLAAWVRDSTGQLLDGKVDWDKVRRLFVYKCNNTVKPKRIDSFVPTPRDRASVPDPGSGAFLTPGSRIRNRFIPDLGSRIPNSYF